MLEIKLERAMASDQLEEDSCGMCGVDFRPAAVVATLAVDSHCQPVCEPCLKHLAERDDASPVVANWGDVYDRYTRAVREYPELYFPTLDALLEHEAARDGYADYSEMQKVQPTEAGNIRAGVLRGSGPCMLSVAVESAGEGAADRGSRGPRLRQRP